MTCSFVESKQTRLSYNGLNFTLCSFPNNSLAWCSHNLHLKEQFERLDNDTLLNKYNDEIKTRNRIQQDNWDAIVVCLSCAIVFLIIIIVALMVKLYGKKNKKFFHLSTATTKEKNDYGSSSAPSSIKSSLKRRSFDMGDNPISSSRYSMQKQSSTTSKASRRVSFHPTPENDNRSNISEEELTTSNESDDSDNYVVSLTRGISIQSENEDILLRKHVFTRQMSGDPRLLNYSKSINEQINILPYNSKYEVKREYFIEKEMLGSGNFGYVFLGEAKSLFYPNSTTSVAIKTVNDAGDIDSVRSILCEIKIMSQIELNMNLVNMVACCTSQFIRSGEIWLLMEYCQLGDMKSYLIDNRTKLLADGRKNSRGSWAPTGIMAEPVGNRILLQWAYDVAMGMKYLARHRIMHGDLAARNVLISAGEDGLVAKVCDFGLSKVFYDSIAYKKEKRRYVPWKWMALEYLEDAKFTLTSDVWSYGVVLWEIFSLGKEPYPGKSYCEMLPQFKSGYRLECPQEAKKIATWSISKVYDKITSLCFVADPMKRASFSLIVSTLEDELTEEEKIRYEMLKGRYLSLGKLRKGSMANIKFSKDMMTQTSTDENEALIQEFLRNYERKEKTEEKESVEQIEIRQNRPNFRRLTSVF